MQFSVILLVLASFAYAENAHESVDNSAYGYHTKIGIPLAESIRDVEQSLGSRIIGGVPAAIRQYPFKTGIIGDIVGLNAVSVCGGALISPNRVATAAHCWNDGQNQAWRLTIVLASTTIFSGGTRVSSSAVATHPSWSPVLARNDVAVVYLASDVPISRNIAPIALPSGNELFENFVGQQAIALGYGITRDGDSLNAGLTLNHVRLNVIGNNVCNIAYPLLIQISNICTSGIGSVGICSGDSGGPLITTRNNRHILIGLSQFRSPVGCESGLPSVFSRVTSFMDFFNSHL
ncbi:hypothetical protein O3G_MSEX006444 [Manduca sexta]|uniref:Peptidase S1 domain-containing protein n=1 Tax=Manduca sexta TaxID=7130 RepID=A0A921Z4V0_MANSE|nr:hypothetical protein O3G_MSEX006444 [Manduca sexta]KAG6450182.1 hypothetical protein O3G_MSEX006444 [Manduca sexta]